MLIDEKQLKEEFRKAKLGALVFFIISMSAFGLAIALIIVSIIVGSNDGNAWFVYGYSAGICMSLGFTFLILRSVFFTAKMKFLFSIEEAQKNPARAQQTPVVEAKPVEAFKEESSRENKLYQQYENLYKQGYITKEELDQKRKELFNE